MQHSDYEIRLLAEQRASELIAQAERLNRLMDVRRRPRRKYFRSLLIRFRRPARDRTVIDLREPPPEPAPNLADAAEGPPGAMHTGLRFSRLRDGGS
jgi:hypothetical protein